jgi:hypothetical protein
MAYTEPFYGADAGVDQGYLNITALTITPTPVPVPSSVFLFGSGLAGLVLVVSEICAGEYGPGGARSTSTRGQERLVG